MKKQKKVSVAAQDQSYGSSPFALGREVFCIWKEFTFSGAMGLPLALSKALIKDTGLDPVWSEKRLLEILSESLLRSVDNLGPIYGKLGQVVASRLAGTELSEKLHLDRLYQEWPAIPFAHIERVLDEELADWRQHFTVDRCPLGVASMAQVHAAMDAKGQEWVIKVVKPQAHKRLQESINALEQLLTLAKPLRLSARGERLLSETEEMLKLLRKESRLDLEMRNLNRMRTKLEGKKQDALRIPRTFDAFCTPRVLVMERFRGASMSDVIAGRWPLKPDQKKKLARRVLHELMVQVFEVGLFHGDPHAGNLMLLEDGSVGLFDWGLTGELRDSDRKHISAILKALLMADVDRLTEALLNLGRESNPDVTRHAIKQQMGEVAAMIQEAKMHDAPLSLGELTETCLAGADALGIRMPEGLLLMVKSILTIEGLARGIDPQVSFSRAAGPILLKIAKPNMSEIVGLGRRLPSFFKKVLAS